MLDSLRDGGGRNSSSEFSLSHHRGVMLGWSHEAAEAATAANVDSLRYIADTPMSPTVSGYDMQAWLENNDK
jgi:hypothetical protein